MVVGEILGDLQRMERELSFEADSVNIYDNNESASTDFVHTTKSKTPSCLKNTK